MSYDSIVITLILVVDSYMSYLMYKAQTLKERKHLKIRFNKVLKSLNMA